jgi:hypothetical protein
MMVMDALWGNRLWRYGFSGGWQPAYYQSKQEAQQPRGERVLWRFVVVVYGVEIC